MTENSNKGNKNWQLEDEKGASAFGGGNSRTQKFGGDHEGSNNIHNEREALLRNNAERPGRNNRRKSTSADPPHHSRRRGQITNRRSRSNTSQRANETRGLRGGRGRQNSRGGPTKFNDWTESNRQGQSGNNKRIGGRHSSHVSRDGDKKSEDAYDDDKEVSQVNYNLAFYLKFYAICTEFHYLVSKYAKKRGVKIINLNPNSLLDAYPKMMSDEILG